MGATMKPQPIDTAPADEREILVFDGLWWIAKRFSDSTWQSVDGGDFYVPTH